MSAANASDRTILEVHQLVAGYGKSEVLHGVSLEVAAGEIVTMVGANGAGKSTLLRSIFGLTDIHGGVIKFKGTVITGLPPHAITAHGLALVPQERNVFPSLTVRENLEMGGFTVDRATLEERIERVFERFPRLRERQRQKAGTLSGGERQMLAIGRGLMTSPELLMLDEPSLGLAPKIVEAVFEQIRLIREGGTTVFLVEQNARRALAIADRAYVLELGRIRHQGSGQELLNDPEVQRAYLGG
ncbi:MAG: branched-chain amino acid ABC transporter ATP-binding protein [Ardenticatenia bacterium]|jgi:ABC-type branched-subunit amino acid transport system ATPase component|nr:MAG: branched-chain amino acid ABC transporter ATP-binding protein [Ardenticatenia bacterium]